MVPSEEPRSANLNVGLVVRASSFPEESVKVSTRTGLVRFTLPLFSIVIK